LQNRSRTSGTPCTLDNSCHTLVNSVPDVQGELAPGVVWITSSSSSCGVIMAMERWFHGSGDNDFHWRPQVATRSRLFIFDFFPLPHFFIVVFDDDRGYVGRRTRFRGHLHFHTDGLFTLGVHFFVVSTRLLVRRRRRRLV
jgi:hypothetical protein